MKQLSMLRLTVYREPLAPDNSELGAPRVWFDWDVKDDEAGLSAMRFLFVEDEYLRAFECGGSFQDGYHQLSTFSECWTFYNWETPRATGGAVSINYQRITVARDIRKRMLTDIGDALWRYDNSLPDTYGHRSSIVIDYTDELDTFANDHGQGSGRIVIEAGADVRDRLGALHGEETFDRCWQTLERLALGTTHCKTDDAEIRVWNDGRSFGFQAGGMYGGVINHGADDEPEWSVHT